MAPTPKKCIFCGRGPNTKEDVWPTWLSKYIPRILEDYHSAVAEVGPNGEIKTIRKKWSGDPQSRRAKCVCAVCNSGWMSRLQEDAKPVVLSLATGANTTISLDQQRLLSVWATMSTITSEYIHPRGATVSVRSLRKFYKTKSGLKLWKIWIGNFQRGTWPPYRVHNAMAMRSRVADPSLFGTKAPYNTQTTTLVFGQLYLHVLSSEIPDVVRCLAFPEAVTNTILKQIWPPRAGAIRWPPRQIMTDRDADNAAGYLFLLASDLLGKTPRLKV